LNNLANNIPISLLFQESNDAQDLLAPVFPCLTVNLLYSLGYLYKENLLIKKFGRGGVLNAQIYG